MRLAKVSDLEILNGLMSVFRAKGYDGSSLNELADATGLKKASLYHRFPGGKKEMTEAVLDFMESWIHNKVYAVLTDEKIPTAQRLGEALMNIKLVYNNGREVCLYRSLSMDTGMALFGEKIEKGINQWLDSFVSLGRAVGLDESIAMQFAKQTFVDIQGSLVLSKALDTTEPFENAIDQIRTRYTVN